MVGEPLQGKAMVATVGPKIVDTSLFAIMIHAHCLVMGATHGASAVTTGMVIPQMITTMVAVEEDTGTIHETTQGMKPI